MRLWHEELIPFLPRQQLLGQHRECCALRGKGWGKKHATVDYVFTHNPALLIAYHYKVMEEMKRRGYHPDPTWFCCDYRGKELGYTQPMEFCDNIVLNLCMNLDETIYPEHHEKYLEECLDNLKSKGIEMNLKGE
jgi:uncharacterized protein (TIGR02328 family)